MARLLIGLSTYNDGVLGKVESALHRPIQRGVAADAELPGGRSALALAAISPIDVSRSV